MTDEKQRKKKVMPVSPGRPKGVPNKLTTTVKEAIVLAAEGLGGTQRLIDWCKEDPKNESQFWVSVYPKLLPLQVSGENGGPIQFQEVRRLIVDNNTND